MVRLSVEWFTRAENNRWLGWKRITQNVHTTKQKFRVKKNAYGCWATICGRLIEANI